MYITINLAFWGTILLLIYILVDLIKNKNHKILRRVIFYSFIFYLLNVIQLTTGDIIVPPQQNYSFFNVQPNPFRFIWEWFMLYQSSGFDWFFWNSVKLSFYNLIMLMPLGVYLSILYRVKGVKKVAVIALLVSITIETYQLTLGYFGLIMDRTFNTDDLILNTLGGVLGYILFEFLKEKHGKHYNN
jgi:glycopeptide antibiotics resistance protein